MSRRKVLMFVQDGVGGAEKMTAMIGNSLNSDQFDVSFCLVKRQVASSIKDFIPHNSICATLDAHKPLVLMLLMCKVIKHIKPHIVFSSVFNINNKILLLKFLYPSIKFIIRCDNYYYTYNSMQQKLLRYTYNKADVIVSQTEEMRDELVQYANIQSKRIKVLHNPINETLIRNSVKGECNPYPNNGNKHFLAVGRFNPQKGFDLLIQAFIVVHNKKKETDLYIVGDTSICNGEVAKKIKEIAQKEGIEEFVHLCGYQANPYPYIKYSDCFVLSSRWEGLPNVLIESQFLGTPAAAFKCIPIIERIIQEGQNGYLADRNNIESLAHAMEKAVDMGRIRITYKSASLHDFEELFV